jgi:hypothetical protein
MLTNSHEKPLNSLSKERNFGFEIGSTKKNLNIPSYYLNSILCKWNKILTLVQRQCTMYELGFLELTNPFRAHSKHVQFNLNIILMKCYIQVHNANFNRVHVMVFESLEPSYSI